MPPPRIQRLPGAGPTPAAHHVPGAMPTPTSTPQATMPTPSAANPALAPQTITTSGTVQAPGSFGMVNQATFKPTPTPTPTPLTPGQQNIDNINSLHDKMAGRQEDLWKQNQGTLQGEMQGFKREADSLNARMGGSIAGGYAGLAGSAMGKGMDSYNRASLQHQAAMMGLEKDRFGQVLSEQHRGEERGWAKEDQEFNRTRDLERMIFESTGEIPSQQLVDSVAAGGGYNPPSKEYATHYTNQVNGMPEGPDKEKAKKLLEQYMQNASNDLKQQIMALTGGQSKKSTDADNAAKYGQQFMNSYYKPKKQGGFVDAITIG